MCVSILCRFYAKTFMYIIASATLPEVPLPQTLPCLYMQKYASHFLIHTGTIPGWLSIGQSKRFFLQLLIALKGKQLGLFYISQFFSFSLPASHSLLLDYCMVAGGFMQFQKQKLAFPSFYFTQYFFFFQIQMQTVIIVSLLKFSVIEFRVTKSISI